MERTYYGDPFDTAEMTDSTKSVRMRPNKNIVLRAVRTWLIWYDNTDSIANLVCKIYSDRSQSAGALIATSANSFARSDIITEANGVKELYFEFDEIPMHSGTFYHFVINCSGYTGSESSHIAWRKAWPDPVYRTGWTQGLESLAVAPYMLTVIGDDL
jgi:hypothetical protein